MGREAADGSTLDPAQLRAGQLFARLDESTTRALLANARVRRLPAGSTLYRTGEPYRGVLFILYDGLMELERADGERLPQLNVVGIPDGVDDARVRQTLLDDYDLEIGAGLGDLAGKAWRIGLMGQSASRRHVLACLTALGSAMAAQGRPADCGAALAAAQEVYDT